MRRQAAGTGKRIVLMLSRTSQFTISWLMCNWHSFKWLRRAGSRYSNLDTTRRLRNVCWFPVVALLRRFRRADALRACLVSRSYNAVKVDGGTVTVLLLEEQQTELRLAPTGMER